MPSWYLAGCAWWDGLVNALPLVGVLGVLALAGCAAPPGPPSATQAGPPPRAASPAGPAYTDMVDPDWAQRVAQATGIPTLAVLAYAGAAIRAAEVYPDCGIGWNTLAAIGLVESDHGSFGGSSIGADFTVTPPIFGVVLDGGDTEHIPDSDGGAVDGIADFDRAVGPMQLIPQTWASWPSDGNGDGIGDPQNIADAAIAAANHMCRASGGMSTDEGWRSGIAAYNSGDDYLRKVATAAQQYVDQAG